MVFFLIPLAAAAAHVFATKAAVAGAHHVAVAAFAHAGPSSLGHAAAHAASTTVQAAIATGSIIAGAVMICGTTIACLRFCNEVEKYRARNHLDPYGQRKLEFEDVEKCTQCTCGDFNLRKPVEGGGQKSICACGHDGWAHRKISDEAVEAEVRQLAKSIGKDASKATLKEFAKSWLHDHY
jgi:hypothetical protein